MRSCAPLGYRSVNYQTLDRPCQLVSGRPFHSTLHGVDVAEAQSVTQVGGEHGRECMGAGSLERLITLPVSFVEGTTPTAPGSSTSSTTRVVMQALSPAGT
jgi:hypothetical protein